MTVTQVTTETRDPICGMIVDETIAIHAERDGETFYFCCDDCREQFQSRLAGDKAEAMAHATAQAAAQGC